MRRLLLAVLGIMALTLPTRSLAAQVVAAEYPGLETGKMWTFDVPPLDYWRERYGFTPAQDWLDHARLSAVRYGGGCSASFVSSTGLVMTNHHCARSCIESATREGEDLLADGFQAGAPEEERECQGLFLDQLESITDVTDQVRAAVPAGADDAAAATARRAAIGEIETACGATADTAACQVVTFYRGGQFKLYRFRRYGDVRLVFAPESQIAFFGGDPDNFTFPRHDLDVSFIRAWEGGRPAETPHHFRWSANGAAEGDLVFVIGNPGSTGRLNTMAQLESLRDVAYPALLDGWARQVAVYQELGARDAERASRYRNTVFGLQNSIKAVSGYLVGLNDTDLMDRKRAWEADFRARVAADPASSRQYGDAWDQVAETRAARLALEPAGRFRTFNAFGSQLLSAAGLLVRYPGEMAKPDGERAAPFRDQARPALERRLFEAAAPDAEFERHMLAAWFEAMVATLPPTDPVRQAAVGGGSPQAAAAALVAGTRVGDPVFHRALVEGGAAAVAASDDPMIVLARTIAPLEVEQQAQVDRLAEREAEADTRIAQALLEVYGTSVAPDATFSLRISDGEVRRFPMNGTVAAPFTTFHGLYDRWAGFAGQEPWHLPPRWLDRKDALRLETQLNAVATADIIGGNSGSPVISRTGEVVGLIFDGNIEMLPQRFLFRERVARSVYVDSRGILEALRAVYGAEALAAELSGSR